MRIRPSFLPHECPRSRGAAGPSRCCPAPWPVASWPEDLDPRACSFPIRLLVTHARRVSLQCGSGKYFIHERGPFTDLARV
jgi:hypothetical protein